MLWTRACKACEAKDREIEHLLALLERANGATEKANARLAEVQSPGVNSRLEPHDPRPPRPPRAKPVLGFPGYAPEVQEGVEVEP